MSNNKPNYTLPIIVMFFLFAMISFVTGFQNPFGVILKGQLELSNFQSQLGNAANFIAYAFMGLPAGMILQKKGYKFSAIAAVLVGLFGVVLMFVSSLFDDKTTIFSVYMTGAFVAGFSMCMLNTVVNPMLNTLGGGGKTGNQLLQFGGATNSLAATICPILVGYLMGGELKDLSLIQARPALYIAMGIFALALIVLAVSKLPEPILEEMAKANLYMTNPLDKGGLELDTLLAGTLVGAYWFLMLVGRLLGGVLGGMVSSKMMLSTVATIVILLIVGAIFTPATQVAIPLTDITAPLNIILLVLCGLCTSVMWGAIFNLAAEGLGKYTAVASGLFMVMVCGGGILPLVQGYVADIAGYINSYWVLFAAAAYILFYAVIGSHVYRRDASAAEIEKEVREGITVED